MRKVEEYLCEYYEDIKYILLLRCKNAQLAEDLRAVVAERVLTTSAKFEGDIKDFRRWISVISKNVFFDYTRQYRNKVAIVDVSKANDFRTKIPSDYENRQLIELALEEIQTLKERKKKIYMDYIKGYKYVELAEMYGEKLNNVKTIIFKIKRDLESKYLSS